MLKPFFSLDYLFRFAKKKQLEDKVFLENARLCFSAKIEHHCSSVVSNKVRHFETASKFSVKTSRVKAFLNEEMSGKVGAENQFSNVTSVLESSV